MVKKRALIFCVAVLLMITAALIVNVFVMRKRIETYTYTEMEYRGYDAKDIAEIKIDHSYFRRILGYNEWRIAVEFEKEPDVFFWFTYRNKQIVFQGVSSEPMMDKESVIAYSEKFKNGTLLIDTTIPSDCTNDLPDGAIAICIDGVTYYGIGEPIPVEPDKSAIEYVEIPAGGGATITAFARLEEGKRIVCLIDGEWYQFHSLEALASSQVNLDK